MTRYVLASHGTLAIAAKEALQMIVGEREEVRAVGLSPEDGPDELSAALQGAELRLGPGVYLTGALFLKSYRGLWPFNSTALKRSRIKGRAAKTAAHSMRVGGVMLLQISAGLGVLVRGGAVAVFTAALPLRPFETQHYQQGQG